MHSFLLFRCIVNIVPSKLCHGVCGSVLLSFAYMYCQARAFKALQQSVWSGLPVNLLYGLNEEDNFKKFEMEYQEKTTIIERSNLDSVALIFLLVKIFLFLKT